MLLTWTISETNPKMWWSSSTSSTNSSFVRATLRAGKPAIFLSVLVPHDADDKPAATVGNVEVTIDANAEWSVSR